MCENDFLNSEKLNTFLTPIISQSDLWRGKKLAVLYIVNPAAGGFTQEKKSRQNYLALERIYEACKDKDKKTEIASTYIYETKKKGHGKEIVSLILEKVVQDKEQDFLLVTAGGDGTGLEVQTALFHAAEKSAEIKDALKNRLTLLRLPLGTGNDGTDGKNIEESLERLLQPAYFALQPAVSVYGQNNKDKPWYAFNIASIGIDAFITHMTNVSHKIMPGDFYKIWLDLACLFYEFKYPCGKAKVDLFDENDTAFCHLEEKILFCLLGVSGYRKYGSGQYILPNDENFSLAKKMSLFHKMLLKGKIKSGKHCFSDKFIFKKAQKIQIDYSKNILVQMDGEVHELNKSDFPIIMEKTEPVIRIIQNESQTIDKGAVRI